MPRTATTPKPPRPIPGRIGAVLKVLATLIAHGRSFIATAAARIDTPEFVPAVAILGTYNVPVILHRLQRGVLRALALQRYLLARAARGRNLRFVWPPCVDLQPHHRPPTRPAPAKRSAPSRPRRPEPALLADDDPGAFRHLTPEELDAEVRRRPIGLTVTYICLDLGIAPCLCDGTFWNKLDRVLRRYGGSLNPLYDVRAKREKTFERERDRRPDTWHIDWRPTSRLTMRQAFGYMIGEEMQGPPPAPSIVPS